jgi:peptidoglycan/LPS O-acetylase OafA/YrhL
MAGAWVVLSGFERFKPSVIVSSVLGLAALLAIVFVATRKDILLGFPDYHAVTICVANAILLSSGISAKGRSSQLLGMAPLVFVGILSYSLFFLSFSAYQ